MQAVGEPWADEVIERTRANVRFWHKADMGIALSDVRFWG